VCPRHFGHIVETAACPARNTVVDLTQVNTAWNSVVGMGFHDIDPYSRIPQSTNIDSAHLSRGIEARTDFQAMLRHSHYVYVYRPFGTVCVYVQHSF
jgi:hypothetical protein